ncbi:hypothetical protein QNI19_37020 [Cytophagaceae bacterium DM2B3-1]|uniref:Uncharacterized protein n=1 Tax=Xanthocytophaga flava TaxID=3048013 RepID=A0ABT7CY62_9BACT|nr:hypothetical protein [Xanthocytophaga flavus]MDJ1498596.1 hypothetical protein [Xanthocytophaga flavus]
MSNWEEGSVPSDTAQVIVNACSVCPTLTSNVSLKTITLNSGSSINLNTYTLTTLPTIGIPDVSMNNAVVYSSNSKIACGSPALDNCIFNGDISFQVGDISRESDYLVSSGGNIYNGKVVFDLIGDNQWFMGTTAGEIFNEDVIIKLRTGFYGGGYYGGGYFRLGNGTAGFSDTLTNIFNKDLFIEADSSNNGCLLSNIQCRGKFRLLAPHSYATILITGNSTFDKSVTLTSNIDNRNYANLIDFLPNDKQVVFKDSVIISTHNQFSENIGGIFMGNLVGDILAGKCIFDSSSILQVNSFENSQLYLVHCEFAKRFSGTSIYLPQDSSSYLGYYFNTNFGKVSISAPTIGIYQNVFNEEVTFTKTGIGQSYFLGGNRFKKKVTVHNQVGSESAIPMSYLINDIISP